jgi:hypothetical protein
VYVQGLARKFPKTLSREFFDAQQGILYPEQGRAAQLWRLPYAPPLFRAGAAQRRCRPSDAKRESSAMNGAAPARWIEPARTPRPRRRGDRMSNCVGSSQRAPSRSMSGSVVSLMRGWPWRKDRALSKRELKIPGWARLGKLKQASMNAWKVALRVVGEDEEPKIDSGGEPVRTA